MPIDNELYIGVMSGTSTDSVDAVLTQINEKQALPIRHANLPIPAELKKSILTLNTHGKNEIAHMCNVQQELSRLYAQAVKELAQKEKVQAIGMHGQTIRHQPQFGYTLQIGDASLLAELSGVTVVSDFRSRDVAAGGQGAPLAPALHQMWRAKEDRVIVNIGGFANITLLPADREKDVAGFDTGPGNVLMDYWCEKNQGTPYDEQGRWADSGNCNLALLNSLLEHPFFALLPPKSTGREDFHGNWLQEKIARRKIAPEDVQATLLELVAQTVATSISNQGYGDAQIYVCGGGCYNVALMKRLQHLLPQVRSTADLGIEPHLVEATAFAWLAHQCMHNRQGNIPQVTGAKGARILGAIYQA